MSRSARRPRARWKSCLPRSTLSPALQEDQATAAGDPAQYSLAKLRLPQAHALAKGANVLIAVIDSGVDANHPDLAGSVAETFDAIPAGAPHKHGTAIAGLIAAHGKLRQCVPSTRRRQAPRARPSTSSKASTGRQLAARMSSI